MQIRNRMMMAALAVPAVLSGSAFGDIVATSGMFEGRGVEVDIDGFGLATAWRVYANVGVGNQVTVVFGDASQYVSLSITASIGSFYDNPLNANNTEVSTDAIAVDPNAEWDSYVTIGNLQLDPGETATSLSPFFAGGSMGSDPWTDGPLETGNGAWYRTPEDPFTNADADGLVLIGQWTVLSGDAVIGDVNLATVIDGVSVVFEGEHFQFVPSPGGLVLLAMFGAAATRRRRR